MPEAAASLYWLLSRETFWLCSSVRVAAEALMARASASGERVSSCRVRRLEWFTFQVPRG
jgi:hypothetical protein